LILNQFSRHYHAVPASCIKMTICFGGDFPQDCIRTPANGINDLQASHFV
jgi:hypothetical protein